MTNPESQIESDNMIMESRDALQELRRSFIELYAAIEADVEAPQDVARRFGLNRNLTWKLSRVITAEDPFAALNHLPGNQGITLALQAIEKGGAPRAAVSQVERALEEFQRVVEAHADDRAQLELTLEAAGLLAREAGFESGRELAFRGNSAIWGVQAKTRLSFAVLGPNKSDESLCDIAHVGGIIGVRRLRPQTEWRLFHIQQHDETGTAMAQLFRPQPLEPGEPDGMPGLISGFSSPSVPHIDIRRHSSGVEFMLPAGPVGKSGVFDAFIGFAVRNLPRYRNAENPSGSIATLVSMPYERSVSDILIHRKLLPTGGLSAKLYGFPHGVLDTPVAQTVKNELPMTERIVQLAGSPPAVAMSHVPRYGQLLNHVMKRMEWNASEFVGYRLVMDHPPMSSKIVLKWDLPERP